MKYESLPAATAQAAAETFGSEHAAALLLAYGTRAAALFLWADSTWHGVDNSDPDWDDIFEFRAFDTSTELRWTHTGHGIGEPTLVTPEPTDKTREYARRLWGAADPGGGGEWVALREARIGVLHVPNPDPDRTDSTEIKLMAVEHVACDSAGNWSVTDERLLGLEWV